MKRKKKLTKAQLEQKVLYFAYGSNMHQPRLEQRVGSVKLIETYSLQNYKLIFDTGFDCSFANVKPCEGETCEGVIYEMTYRQLLMLDKFEGLYERVKIMYGERRLHFYVSELRYERRQPSLTMEYYALLMLGCVEHNLNKSKTIVQTLHIVGRARNNETVSTTFYTTEEEW